jgi:hypothetical protein
MDMLVLVSDNGEHSITPTYHHQGEHRPWTAMRLCWKICMCDGGKRAPQVDIVTQICPWFDLIGGAHGGFFDAPHNGCGMFA